MPPEVVADDFDCDFGKTLKPDAIWIAAGWEGGMFYEGSSWVGLAKYFPR